jgi:Ca-activated chloride channel family protein
MFRFAHPDTLYLLGLIPLLIALFLWGRANRKRQLKKFGEEMLMQELMPNVSAKRPVWKFYLTLLAIIAMIFVVAGPQFGSKLQTATKKGVELIIALDVSNSMLAEDIAPNRLKRAKQAISQMVDKLGNDKIGLIVFAGDAYTQLPITTDYASAKMFLSTINTGIVPTQGTAIGKAINLGIRSFGPQEEVSRAIIVITDGENHEDDAIKAAEAAQEKGIIVYTIGMGSAKGAPIPAEGNNTFRKDREGNVVITKLDEKLLQEIAIAGGGKSIRANNTKVGLKELLKEINKMEKSEIKSKVYSEYDDQFQWLALIAFVILMLEILILERKNKFLKDIRLFK